MILKTDRCRNTEHPPVKKPVVSRLEYRQYTLKQQLPGKNTWARKWTDQRKNFEKCQETTSSGGVGATVLFLLFFIETSVWHNVYTNCLCSWVKKSKHQGGIKIFGSHLLCGSYSDLFSFSPGSVCLVVYGWEKALYDRRSQCNHVRTRSFSPTERTREERPNGRKIRPPINLSSSYSRLFLEICNVGRGCCCCGGGARPVSLVNYSHSLVGFFGLPVSQS